MKISLSTAIVLHALLVAGQFANYALAIVPSDYKYIVVFALALIQAGVGFLQHFSPSPESK